MQPLTRRSFLNLIEGNQNQPKDWWLHVNRTAMACRFEVTLPMSDQAGVAVATEALNQIDRLEAQLSVFRESSEVSCINRQAATEAVSVEDSLFDLLTLCTKLHRDTEGTFDITSGPLTRCWGFLKREGRVPTTDEIESARLLVGSNQLLFDAETRTIRFIRPGMEINLGSIGKGYALDRVTASICNRVRMALLNAGASSIYAVGAGDRDQGWTVGLRHPRHKNERLATLRLRDCAVSTSGSEEQFFEHDSRRYGHIIDPRSGWPAQVVTSVSVVARSAAISDALATAFYIGGKELAERFCTSHPEVLVIMLESSSESPVVIGSHGGCQIESVA
ncbi:MAG: FAD:protein FMN transferase [Pyrinomonadaceae bacterium]|nr:FAD:protein FMN transferase [Pyrinomonadaceae bacterium]